MNYGYSDLNTREIFFFFFLKWTTGVSHFKKINWHNLFPMIDLELSSKNQNFGKSYPSPKLKSFCILKDFCVMILTNVLFFHIIYLNVNCESLVTQGINIYKTIHAWVKVSFKMQNTRQILMLQYEQLIWFHIPHCN